MRMEIVEVRLGCGTEIITRRFGRLKIHVETRPAFGWVLAFPTGVKGYRSRWFLFILGGPLASALAYVFLVETGPVKAWYFEWSLSWVFYAIQRMVQYLSFWMLLVSLWPRRSRLYGQYALSDGLQMLMILFLGRAGATKVFAYEQAHRARFLWAEGRRDEALVVFREAKALPGSEQDLSFCAIMASAIAEQGRVDEALEMLRELLRKAGKDWEAYGEIADAFCSIVIYERRTAAFPEAEQMILKAIARCPDPTSLKGTLGGILFEQGRYSEACRLLETLHYASQKAPDLAITGAYLAHLALRIRDKTAAQRYAEVAKFYGKDHRLVKRLMDSLEAELASSTGQKSPPSR
jgi:tetratricopeptide (TPR) repeat protein